MKARRRVCTVCGKPIPRGMGVSRGASVIHAKCAAELLRATPAPVDDWKARACGERTEE